MKKLSVKMLAMLMILFQGIVSVSCSDDEPKTKETPRVSFERPSYALASGDLEIKVTADVAPESNITIPVSVESQNATEGTDYTMPVKSVTIKAGETSGVFTISRSEESVGEDNLEMTINLGQGDGYNLGLRNFVTVTLLSQSGYLLSFTEPNSTIKTDATFKLEVSPVTGWASLPAEDTFTLEVDPEGTTAVEGTHFTVSKSVTVAAKKRFGEFEVKFLKHEEGKDVVVLRISEKAGYAFGANPIITIKLSGLDNFTGTWAFKEVYNYDGLSMWQEDMDKMPAMSSSDKMTFAGTAQEYTFTPAFTGGLKNYFGTESRKVTYSGLETYEYMLGMSNLKEVLQVYMFPETNIKFSAKESEKRSAKVGFRIITVGTEEILECIIDDYEPAEGEIWYDNFEYMRGDDPTHPAAWFPYVLYFTRVN